MSFTSPGAGLEDLPEVARAKEGRKARYAKSKRELGVLKKKAERAADADRLEAELAEKERLLAQERTSATAAIAAAREELAQVQAKQAAAPTAKREDELAEIRARLEQLEQGGGGAARPSPAIDAADSTVNPASAGFSLALNLSTRTLSWRGVEIGFHDAPARWRTVKKLAESKDPERWVRLDHNEQTYLRRHLKRHRAFDILDGDNRGRWRFRRVPSISS